MSSNIQSPYNNTVILNSDSLDKLIELVKTYPIAGKGTGIKVVPANNNYNLQIQNAHKYVSTSSMASKSSSSYNEYEIEIANRFNTWSTDHAAQICVIDTSYILPDSPSNADLNKRYTWVQGGSLLEFYSNGGLTNSTTTQVNSYKNNTTAGTFTVVENNGTKAHLVRINGFDTSGNYTGAISMNSSNKILISNTADASRNPSYGGSESYSSLGMSGSIVTYGGIDAAKSIKGYKVHAAVFNDYAEYRNTADAQPGQCVIEQGDGSMKCSTSRLQPGGNIVSDTFGFSIGETEQAQTPIAVCGRVLAYPYEEINKYKAGDAVCSAPNGKISLMTREEIKEWPDRIIGYVSEIPNYENWGSNNTAVNGRIWIKIK